MSRIGKKVIVIPEGVEVTIANGAVTAKGKHGELTQSFEAQYVSVKLEGGELQVERANDTKEARARHGLYRSLFANIIAGVNEGFSKSLEVRGVGYRVALKDQDLEFNLGYSHSITFNLPEGINVTFHEKNQNIFTLSGRDKQLVGQVAAKIRELRKPEPYKGKGIRYTDEQIVLKAGKSASK
jgi:large subunit ribosomal protein L6